jgi:hypothetical protein
MSGSRHGRTSQPNHQINMKNLEKINQVLFGALCGVSLVAFLLIPILLTVWLIKAIL